MSDYSKNLQQSRWEIDEVFFVFNILLFKVVVHNTHCSYMHRREYLLPWYVWGRES